MSFLSRLFGSRDASANLRPLWHRIVEIAREPQWYAQHGVADTVPGRFDAIALVLVLVLLRLERDEALIPASVRLTELFVDDMDGQLRQNGIGDLVVGKHMGKLMGVIGGRLGAFREALPQGEAALSAVIARNVTLLDGADPLLATRAALALSHTLDETPDAELLAGTITR